MGDSPRRRELRDFDWWLDLAPAVAIALLLLWALLRRSPAHRAPAFDPDAAAALGAGDGRGAPYVSSLERDLAARQGPGLAGVVPGAPEPAEEAPPQDAGAVQGLKPRGAHPMNAMMRAELVRLTRITDRYYQNEPKVREVDRAFGSLPRYMAVKDRFYADHDAYAFAHDALALPEVRATVRRYALDPKVWSLTLSMMREALRQKPPKPLYDEMKRFFTHDKQMAAFAVELSTTVLPHVASLLPQAVKPGEDLSALKDLAKDLNVGKSGFSPPKDLAFGGPPSGPASLPPPPEDTLKPTGGVPGLGRSELKIGETDEQKRRQLDDLGKGSRPR